jgi:hypothetical protein
MYDEMPHQKGLFRFDAIAAFVLGHARTRFSFSEFLLNLLARRYLSLHFNAQLDNFCQPFVTYICALSVR